MQQLEIRESLLGRKSKLDTDNKIYLHEIIVQEFGHSAYTNVEQS